MLSVSTLNEQVKALLETQLGYIEVVGEVSRFIKHASGHWYFTLKDENASVSASMFKSSNSKVSFDLYDGMRVVVYAKVSMYTASGNYQLILLSMRPDGEGELEKQLLNLKNKLASAGFFDESLKKPIPQIPRIVGVVTSATSAALADMLKIAKQHWNMSRIIVFDTLTQGMQAPQSIIKALNKAQNYGVDVIVLARGGGSKEDLWCFNDEELANAIFALNVPIVTGIGHEIDESIADLVADYRAPTPTAAMTAVLPDKYAMIQYIDRLNDNLNVSIKSNIQRAENSLSYTKVRFSPQALHERIEAKQSLIASIRLSLKSAFDKKAILLGSKISSLQAGFDTYLNFFNTSKDLVELRKDGIRVNIDTLKLGDEFSIIGQNSSKTAKIVKESK